ncbi:MAG TPA: alanyl-tRNA editing protein [Chloroflexota bacterium]
MTGTEQLYLRDSYDRAFVGRVVDVQEHNVVLDRSLFYPRGGGQMADRGMLEAYGRTYLVVSVEKRGGTVYHAVDGPLPSVGEEVRGTIDWEHRYRQMRTHTALHVLCGVIYHRFSSLVTGCQMYPDRARMDFTLSDLSRERVDEIERLSNEAIRAGYPVRVRFVPRREANLMPELIRTKVSLVPPEINPIRVVEIVGLDLQADGGTHVANTIEVGSIRITKTENKGRENRRLEIELQPAVPE